MLKLPSLNAWPTLLGLALLKVASLLPFAWQIWIGKQLGLLIYLLATGRRRVTETNIRLCFPNLNRQDQKKLVRDVFRQNGAGLFETAAAWWGPLDGFDTKIRLEGRVHLDEALDKGKGVILLGGHFSTLDLGGLLFSRYFTLHTMYRPHNNPVMEEVISRGRSRFIDSLIDRHDFRAVIRALKRNQIVWYAPDQDFGPSNSVYAPFFGVEAATVTATARLARVSGSPVIMLSHHRNPDNSYTLRVHEAIDPFPLADDRASANRINSELERGIMYDPSQYMWMHRRFKTHPKGKGYVYRTNS